MKLVHLIKPKQAKAVVHDVLATVNAALKSRKLQKPRRERPLTALEWVKKINRDLHFAAIRAVGGHRK
jgi:hypothetical protein